MIQQFTFGEPFQTGAVTDDSIAVKNGVFTADSTNFDDIPYLSVESPKKLVYALSDEDIVYGLGEQSRGLNKRGWHYESLNTDNPHQDEGRTCLYSSHNFLLIDGVDRFGLFLDTPSVVRYDIGYTRYDEMVIEVEGDYDLYVIEGETLLSIVTELRRLTGRSYVPPKWGFGFGQSRWGYKTADDVRNIVKKYRMLDMPVDAVYMDIDYMEDYKDFTVDPEKFPDFTDFNAEMDREGIHLVPIIDAGIKQESGYDVYEEGVEKGYFCTKEDGNLFVLGVWPGKSVFPDVLNKEAADWFGSQYKKLTDAGVRGFWNDMNEPSVFYTEDRLAEAFQKVDEFKTQDLGAVTFFEMRDTLGCLSNDPKDYKAFFHNAASGRVRHDLVHNLYGYKLTEAAGEKLQELVPDERTLLFSRSSYIGMHRTSGIWYGDNSSYFSHILINLKQAMNVNMVGFLYSGADIAGFGNNTTPDLAMRWIELGIFLPLFRNHSSRGTREQEFFRFGMNEDFRHLLKLRYALVPYLYSEFMQAVLSDGMFVRPLSFVYEDDERSRRVEDQAFIGNSLMIAPVYEQNKDGRFVYVPERMKLFRMRSPEEFDTEVLEKGDHFVKCALNEVLLFVPEGKAVYLTDTKEVRSVRDLEDSFETVLKFDESPVTVRFYSDNGMDREISEENVKEIVL